MTPAEETERIALDLLAAARIVHVAVELEDFPQGAGARFGWRIARWRGNSARGG